MMAGRPSVGSVDEYIAGFPPATARMLQDLRTLISLGVGLVLRDPGDDEEPAGLAGRQPPVLLKCW